MEYGLFIGFDLIFRLNHQNTVNGEKRTPFHHHIHAETAFTYNRQRHPTGPIIEPLTDFKPESPRQVSLSMNIASSSYRSSSPALYAVSQLTNTLYYTAIAVAVPPHEYSPIDIPHPMLGIEFIIMDQFWVS